MWAAKRRASWSAERPARWSTRRNAPRRAERRGADVDSAAPDASAPDVAVPVDDVLERAQLAQPDRAAGVQLLRRVADLGAHPELAPVGEARRGVDVDAGGIDATLERAGRRGAVGHDRLRVARAVRVDV